MPRPGARTESGLVMTGGLPERGCCHSLRAMQPRGANPARPPSDLALCIQSLVHEGRPAISVQPSGVDDADALPLLQQLDGFTRDELALDLPAFSPNAALWAARLFHQLCRFVACRDIPEEQIRAACRVPFPGPRSPETDWSADLTLQHLPGLFQLARHLSNADPLVEHMKEIAADWPLSSVGLRGLGNLKLDSFAGHPGLRRLYADRIIATGDTSRTGDPRLDDLLRADLGVHRELAPALAATLFETAHDTR